MSSNEGRREADCDECFNMIGCQCKNCTAKREALVRRVEEAINPQQVTLRCEQDGGICMYGASLPGPPCAKCARNKCDGNHGGPPCADPECWALPAPTIGRVLNDRGADYGPYDDMAQTIGRLQDACRLSIGYENLNAGQKHALEMICVKMGRILTGDPNKRDSWVDIQGYAKLGEPK